MQWVNWRKGRKQGVQCRSYNEPLGLTQNHCQICDDIMCYYQDMKRGPKPVCAVADPFSLRTMQEADFVGEDEIVMLLQF